MSILKIYYSVVDCGDGSAYPKFFTDKALAEYHQKTEERESWAEDCTGSLIIEGNDLGCSAAETKESYYLELVRYIETADDEEKEKVRKFVEVFFPHGLPKFDVIIIDSNYYGILVKSKMVYKHFSGSEPVTEKSRLALEEKLKT